MATDGRILDPRNMLGMIPIGCFQGFKPWVGMKASTLMVAGIIDLLPFFGIELFGLGLIITSCAAKGDAKGVWVKAATINTLLLICLWWLVLPMYIGIGMGVFQVVVSVDKSLIDACESEASLAAYCASYDNTPSAGATVATVDVEQPALDPKMTVVAAVAAPVPVVTVAAVVVPQ